MPRPMIYRPEFCEAVIQHMREGASLTSFAASVGVARSTINFWIGEHPDFADAVGVAKAACAAWWEGVARQNAVTGAGNATLTVFGLCNMGRDDWRQRQEIDHSSSDGTMSPGRTLDDFYTEAGGAG